MADEPAHPATDARLDRDSETVGGDVAVSTAVPRRKRWPIIAAVTAAAALLVWVLDLPSKINSFAKEGPEAAQRAGDFLFLDKALTGLWTSENMNIDAASHAGDVPLLEGGPVDIDLRVYKGEATGEIVSDGLKDNWIFSRVQFEGRKTGKAIEGVVWDYVEGQKQALAVIRIEPDHEQDGALAFTVLKQGPHFLPAKAKLYPNLNGKLPEGELNQKLSTGVAKEVQRRIDRRAAKH